MVGHKTFLEHFNSKNEFNPKKNKDDLWQFSINEQSLEELSYGSVFQ